MAMINNKIKSNISITPNQLKVETHTKENDYNQKRDNDDRLKDKYHNSNKAFPKESQNDWNDKKSITDESCYPIGNK